MDEMPGALILVGNKTDLPDEGTEHQREVSRETGETFAKVLTIACCYMTLATFAIKQ